MWLFSSPSSSSLPGSDIIYLHRQWHLEILSSRIYFFPSLEEENIFSFFLSLSLPFFPGCRGREGERVLDWGWCDREINATVVKERGATHRVSLWRCCSTFVHVSRLYTCINIYMYVHEYIPHHPLCNPLFTQREREGKKKLLLTWCFCCVCLW